jgi:pyrroline-5-carboxylate reductase
VVCASTTTSIKKKSKSTQTVDTRLGDLGTAILSGIFDSLSPPSDTPDQSKALAPTDPTAPAKLPARFSACVTRAESGRRIKKELEKYETPITIHGNNNLQAVQDADIIILGCKPHVAEKILGNEEMRAALKGKLLISILAGVTEIQLGKIVYPDGTAPFGACKIVRAMPNMAATVRESMTVIGTSDPPLPEETNKMVDWIFTRIGRIVRLPPANMDACTALCGSGPGFVAIMLESMVAGAVAMGVPREDAYIMAAQTMRGTTGLVLQGGEHPAMVRDKVMTPGGCTIGGMLVLEEGGLRGTIAKAIREATVVASQLGEGKQGMNGTRF